MKQVFSVYDSKAQTYCTPFFSVNISTALRDFAHAANDQGTDLYKFSLDYTLFHIGSYNEESGAITSQIPINLGTANQFIQTTIEVSDDV